MAMLVDCCFFISFFGMIFYMSMGFIILGQPEFLKFVCNDAKKSIGACFISCAIFLIFFVVMIVLKRKGESDSVERVNYTGFEPERERQNSIMGVQMGEMRYQNHQD